jgi:hypothetical protein
MQGIKTIKAVLFSSLLFTLSLMPTETFSLAVPLFSGCPKDMEEKD